MLFLSWIITLTAPFIGGSASVVKDDALEEGKYSTRISKDGEITRLYEPPPRPSDQWHIIANQPFFDNVTKDHVRAQLGKTAKLHCTVNQIGDRVVSWVRKSDYHILTVGQYTYTRDTRFKAKTDYDDSGRYTLEIHFARKSDSGIYECQLNSEPKISKEVQVDVLAAMAKIVGPPELYITRGSPVTITCKIIDGNFEPDMFVIWYHNHTVIDNKSSKSGITVKTTARMTTITSKLYINQANHQNSGNYSCKPSFSEPDSITLHIVKDEEAAAMQYSRQTSIISYCYTWTMTLSGFVISYILLER